MKFAVILLGVFLFLMNTFTISYNAHAQAVGVWLLDEGSGKIALDGSLHANDGQIVGQARWTAGKFGSALEFDGGYVEVPHHSSLDVERFTITAWVRIPQIAGPYQMIVSKEIWPDRNYAMWVRPSLMMFGFTTVGGARDIQVAGVDIADGQWHFVAGTYDGLEITSYVDGMKIDSRGVIARPSINQASLMIGAASPNGAGPLKGAIDEIAIYSIALDEREIESVMEGLSEEFQAVKPVYKLTTTWGEIKARP